MAEIEDSQPAYTMNHDNKKKNTGLLIMLHTFILLIGQIIVLGDL